jgi:hypothetical protein
MKTGNSRYLALFASMLALVALACTCSVGNLFESAPSENGDGSIGDTVWLDSNGDGIMSGPEMGLAGVTVRLLNADGQSQQETQTDDEGNYLFSGTEAGTYQIEFVPPPDMSFTIQDVGEDDEIDSDARQSDGRTDLFDFDGGVDRSRDAGLIPSGPPTPQPTNTAAPTPTSQATSAPPTLTASYTHTQPGQYSEIIVQIDNLSSGQEVVGIVVGPAVDGDGTFTLTADENGTGQARVRILQFGTYSVDILELGLSATVEVTVEEPQ